MKQMQEFIEKFTKENIFLDENLVKQGREFYLRNKNTSTIIDKIDEQVLHAGLFLGETKSNQFTCSMHLLELIAQHTNKKIIVEDKAEWLFACGRDVFSSQVENDREFKEGTFVIVINKNKEVLGLAKKVKLQIKNKDRSRNSKNSQRDTGNTIYKNILDIGDYLRREQSKKNNK